MSYSFSVQAPTKAEAEIKVRDKLVEVRTAQPAHELDCDQAFDAAAAFIKLMPDDPARDVWVSVNGSIWQVVGGAEQVTISVSVHMATR